MAAWILGQYREESADGVALFATCLECCQVRLLHDAAQSDWDEIVELIIALGYDGNFRDEMTCATPLDCAMQNGSYRALDALLEAGAATDIANQAQDLGDGQFTPLLAAVKKRNLKAVSLLLAAGANANDREEPSGLTALHLAANTGQVEVVRKRLESGSEVDAGHSLGTPLHFAAAGGSDEAVELLINVRIMSSHLMHIMEEFLLYGKTMGY